MTTLKTVLVPGWALPPALFRTLISDITILDTATTDLSPTVRHWQSEGCQIHVIGVSLGGYCALKWALAHPGQIHRLTLVGICPGFPPAGLDGIHTALAQNPQDFLMGFYRQCFFPSDVFEHCQPLLQHNLLEMVAVAHNTFDKLYEYHVSASDLSAAKATLIHGEKDPVAPFGPTQQMAEAAKVPLIPIKNAGHIPFFNPTFPKDTLLK